MRDLGTPIFVVNQLGSFSLKILMTRLTKYKFLKIREYEINNGEKREITPTRTLGLSF